MKLILLNIIVGAVIGLFTNWIAIVMLFRPHTEKKLFGKRLPFTPGLIPSRQEELSEKLGQIVEEDLLTPEGLSRSIKRPELEFAITRTAVRSIGDTLQTTPTIGELIKRIFGEQALEQVEHWLVARSVLFLQSDSGRHRLEQLADSLFEHLRGSLSDTAVRRELAHSFCVPLHASLSTGALTWREALPDGARSLIEERLQAQVDPLVDGASDWLVEPAVVQAISQMLTEKVGSIPLIGGMAKSFLTPDRVLSDIVPRLQSVIRSYTTRELIRRKMQETVVGFWDMPVGMTLGRMSADDLCNLLDKMLQVLLERVFSEDAGSRDMFRSLVVGGLLAGAKEQTIGDLVRRLFDAVLEFDLRSLYIAHTEDTDRLITSGWRYLRGKMIDELPRLLEALAIRQIVRDQVASYPIVTLEKLIVSVVNKELKMITYLGGVLGAIIGLIQGLISLW